MCIGDWSEIKKDVSNAIGRYTVCMNFRALSSPLFCTMLLFSTQATAEDAVLPPPSVDQSERPAVSSAGEVRESAPNLHEEFSAPDDETSVDVRSYQRKDGARITEYAVNGQVYKIKVQPAGGLPAYYLYRTRSGEFERRLPGGKKVLKPPTWTLKEF